MECVSVVGKRWAGWSHPTMMWTVRANQEAHHLMWWYPPASFWNHLMIVSGWNVKTLFCILTRVRMIMDSTTPCFVNVIVSYFDFTVRAKYWIPRLVVSLLVRLVSFLLPWIAMYCHWIAIVLPWIAIPPISSDILLKIVSSKMILMIIIMVMMVIIPILIMMTMIIAFIQSLFSQPPTAAGGNHHLSGFCQNITTIVIITINTINFFKFSM